MADVKVVFSTLYDSCHHHLPCSEISSTSRWSIWWQRSFFYSLCNISASWPLFFVLSLVFFNSTQLWKATLLPEDFAILGGKEDRVWFCGVFVSFFSSWTANCPCIELRIFQNKTTESPSYFVCTFLVVFSFGDNALLLWGKMFTKWYWWLKRYLGLLDENGAINRYTCRKATKNNSDTKFCSFLHHMTLNLLDWFLWHSSKLKLM